LFVRIPAVAVKRLAVTAAAATAFPKFVGKLLPERFQDGIQVTVIQA
jgi:hypothetical protein